MFSPPHALAPRLRLTAGYFPHQSLMGARDTGLRMGQQPLVHMGQKPSSPLPVGAKGSASLVPRGSTTTQRKRPSTDTGA